MNKYIWVSQQLIIAEIVVWCICMAGIINYVPVSDALNHFVRAIWTHNPSLVKIHVART